MKFHTRDVMSQHILAPYSVHSSCTRYCKRS